MDEYLEDPLRLQELESVCNQLAITPWAQVHSLFLKQEEERGVQVWCISLNRSH